MKLDAPFYRLPLRFDAAALAAEVSAFPAPAWVPHPQKFDGNDYVPLITPSGIITNEFAGPMGPTIYLDQSPYLSEVMATLDCVWGRSRLMGLVSGATVPPHVDTNYYWRTHIRVHIPIVTNPDVRFTCGDTTVQMKAGECWVFDTFRQHHVANDGADKRIHLVADTIGGERLWDLVHAAKQPGMQDREPELITRGTGGGKLRFEQANFPTIMSPWEMRCLFDELLGKTVAGAGLDVVRLRLDRLCDGWAAAWAEHEDRSAGLPQYRGMAAAAIHDLSAVPGGSALLLDNGITLYTLLMQTVFDNVVESERVRMSRASALAAATGQRLAS